MLLLLVTGASWMSSRSGLTLADLEDRGAVTVAPTLLGERFRLARIEGDCSPTPTSDTGCSAVFVLERRAPSRQDIVRVCLEREGSTPCRRVSGSWQAPAPSGFRAVVTADAVVEPGEASVVAVSEAPPSGVEVRRL